MTDLYDGRDLIEHERGGNVVPYTGMGSESQEAAMVYYDVYAIQSGLIIIRVVTSIV
jgi:hypothetical protein